MIKVALYGMDERAANVITMFLSKNTQIPTTITPQGEQSVAIVDLDGVNAHRLWLDLRRQFHGPAIVLSVREQTLRNAVCLAKPFNAQAFLTVLAEVKEALAQPAALPSAKAAVPAAAIPAEPLLAQHPEKPIAHTPDALSNQTAHRTDAKPTPVQPDLPTPLAFELKAAAVKPIKPDQPSNAAHLISDEPDEEGSFQLPDEVYTNATRRAEVYFNVNQTLLGLCKLASKQAQTSNSVVWIDGFIKPCYVYPDTKHIFTEMRWRYLKSISMMDLSISPIKLSLVPVDSIAPVTSNDPRIRETEGLIWSIAAWSSRGRVPVGTPLDHPVHLLHWPNLTRLSDIPGAMQISALWIKQPTSLLETANILGLPYRHVFSFYVACHALGLVHIEVATQPAQAQIQNNAHPSKAAPITTEKRGLFSRMLSKLGIN